VTSFVEDGNKENVPSSENDEIRPISEDEESSKPFTGTENGSENSQGVRLEGASTKPSTCKSCWNWWCALYSNYSFMILAVGALLLAYAYPPLGAVYVYPQITSSYIALIIIFLLAGLGLKTKELRNALQSIGFNAFVQIFNFGVDSSIVFGFAMLLLKIGAISDALAQGMIICGCLSVTVNMVFVLTKNAGGDEAIAIFHAAFGNFVGVFLTPLLILFYTGTNASLNIQKTYLNLFFKVILPVFVGQLLQYFVPFVVRFAEKNKANFKMLQEWALVFIIYTTFSQTFYSGQKGTSVKEVFIMIATILFILILLMTLAWYALKLLFRDKPKLRVMGLFGCTHKTVAVGVPLIQALYQQDPFIGLYTLPILVWHPMQLFLGSWLAPYLASFVEREEQRLSTEPTSIPTVHEENP